MTAIPNQHWGGENRTSVSRFVTSIVECSVHENAVIICFSIFNLFLDISNSSFVQFQVSTILSFLLLYKFVIQHCLISLITQILLFLSRNYWKEMEKLADSRRGQGETI